MPQMSMIVDTFDQPATTIFLVNNTAIAPALGEIDVLLGPVGCATSGRIRNDGTAYVQVNPDKHLEVENALFEGVDVTLTYTIRNGVKNVTNILCPGGAVLTSIQRSTSALNDRVGEIAELLKGNLAGNLVEELRHLNRTSQEILRVLREEVKSESYVGELKVGE